MVPGLTLAGACPPRTLLAFVPLIRRKSASERIVLYSGFSVFYFQQYIREHFAPSAFLQCAYQEGLEPCPSRFPATNRCRPSAKHVCGSSSSSLVTSAQNLPSAAGRVRCVGTSGPPPPSRRRDPGVQGAAGRGGYLADTTRRPAV